jgi:hypothetical protein
VRYMAPRITGAFMQRRDFLFVTGMYAVVMTTSPRAHAADTPKDIVEGLYRTSIKKRGDWDSVLLKPAVRKRIFSKGLLRAWNAADARNRAGEVGWLDFDIPSNSQDPSVHDLRVTVASEASTKTTVRAVFRVAPDPKASGNQVLFDFIVEDGGWKLDDIRGNPGGDQWSIRKLAQDAAAAKR